MALSKNNDNITYLLGRVFAVLRQAELRMKGKSKKDFLIVDKKMSEVYQQPGFWFSRFNSQFSRGLDNYLKEEMSEIIEKIPSSDFVKRIPLNDQFTFILGFHHERSSLEQVYEVIDGIV